MSNFNDNIVLMYGCPITDWKPTLPEREPIPVNPIPTVTMDINYFKNKFEELFRELESVMGECKYVNMERSGDYITTEIKF